MDAAKRVGAKRLLSWQKKRILKMLCLIEMVSCITVA